MKTEVTISSASRSELLSTLQVVRPYYCRRNEILPFLKLPSTRKKKAQTIIDKMQNRLTSSRFRLTHRQVAVEECSTNRDLHRLKTEGPQTKVVPPYSSQFRQRSKDSATTLSRNHKKQLRFKTTLSTLHFYQRTEFEEEPKERDQNELWDINKKQKTSAQQHALGSIVREGSNHIAESDKRSCEKKLWQMLQMVSQMIQSEAKQQSLLYGTQEESQLRLEADAAALFHANQLEKDIWGVLMNKILTIRDRNLRLRLLRKLQRKLLFRKYRYDTELYAQQRKNQPPKLQSDASNLRRTFHNKTKKHNKHQLPAIAATERKLRFTSSHSVVHVDSVHHYVPSEQTNILADEAEDPILEFLSRTSMATMLKVLGLNEQQHDAILQRGLFNWSEELEAELSIPECWRREYRSYQLENILQPLQTTQLNFPLCELKKRLLFFLYRYKSDPALELHRRMYAIRAHEIAAAKADAQRAAESCNCADDFSWVRDINWSAEQVYDICLAVPLQNEESPLASEVSSRDLDAPENIISEQPQKFLDRCNSELYRTPPIFEIESASQEKHFLEQFDPNFPRPK